MKKRFKLLAGLAVIPLALTGCSGTGGGEGNSSSSPKTIEAWVAWTEGSATADANAQMVKQFEEKTGYTVNVTNFTNDMLHDKLIASAAGGNLPDVVYGLPEYVAEFNKMGILADLTSAWDSWEDKDKVSDAVKSAMTIDGKIIGFPYETTVRAYLVHDDLMTQAGIAVPTTWEDVVKVGSAMQDATGDAFFSLTSTGVRAPQEMLVYLAQKGLVIAEAQDGGGFKNTWNDNPDQLAKAASVFQFYSDLIGSGSVNPNSATYGWEETDENFATGLAATAVDGNWLVERESTNPDTMGDVSIHPIPYPSDGQPATYLESKPMMVMASSDVLDGATQLARAWASEEWQKAAFADRSALNDVQTDSKWSKDFSTLMSTGVTYPPITLSSVTQNMIDSIAMVLQAGNTPEEAAAWLSDAINESLSDSGELAGA